jgi:phage portal protein BeeE/intein/homing endonuclease
MAFFNFNRFFNRGNSQLVAGIDFLGDLGFKINYNSSMFLHYYYTIAPLNDAINKIISFGSTIKPYAFIGNEPFSSNPNTATSDVKAFYKWVRNPNPQQTGIQLRKEGLLYFLATGNNFIEITYKDKNNILSIKNINPSEISIYKTRNEIDYYEYKELDGTTIKYQKVLDSQNYLNSIRYKYSSNNLVGDKVFRELLHYREEEARAYDDIAFSSGWGVSKLAPLRDEMILYKEGNISNRASLKNSLSAKKMFSIDFKDIPSMFKKEDIDNWKKDLEKNFSGSQNSGKTLFTNLNMKAIDLQNPFVARDLEFNVGLRRLRVAFYNLFNIPLPLVEGEFTSNSNMKEANLNLYDAAILPTLESYYEFIYLFFIKDFYPNSKISEIKYIDSEIPAITMRNAELVNILSNANVATKNELRQKVGLNRIDGLDAVYVDGNQAPIGEDTNTDDAIGIPLSQTNKSFKALSDIDLKPTEEMAKEAEKGLRWREEFGRGGTAVGVARANQLKNRENLTPKTIGRMVSFFARHEVDKQAEGFNQGEEGFPSAGRIAWCLTHDTQVLLADGSLKTIGEIVDKKLDVEVIALHKNGLLKPAKIINWLKLESKKEDFLVLRRGLAKSNERGIVDKPKLFATKDHPIYCGKDLGYIKMQDLTNENQVYVVEEYVDEVGEQIIAGHLMGDGSLTKNSQLTISRCEKHKDYLDDTKRLLEHLGFSETREIITKKGFGIGKKQYTSRSKVNHYMKANAMFKIVNKKRVLINDLNKLGSIGLARWIMDDGSLHQKNNDRPSYRIHIEGFDKDSADKIHEFFVNKYGDNVKLHKRENTDGYVLYCGVDATDKIANEIAPYVCDIMKYKLPEHLRKTEYILKNYEPKKTYVSSPQSINYIRNVKKSDGNLQNFKYRYDLTIEDANSFVANGIIVHNCLWGGDAGKSWANRKWAEIKKERDK